MIEPSQQFGHRIVLRTKAPVILSAAAERLRSRIAAFKWG
jgi:hypothetical protein